MSFTTVEDAALSLDRDIVDFNMLELQQLEALILHVDGIINSYCGMMLTATDYEDKRYDGTGTNSLDLRLFPINELTAVKIRNSDGSFTDITDGIEYFDDGVIQFTPYATTETTTFTAGTKNIYVTFNAGYTVATTPTELKYAATQLVTINFNKITDRNITFDEETFDNIRFKNSPIEFNAVVKRVLDRYRLVSVY